MRSITVIISAIALALIVGLGAGLLLGSQIIQPSSVTHTITISQVSILVNDPYPYFPTGYNSKLVNLSQLSNGDLLSIGSVTFQLDYPSNLETMTTSIGGTSTVITVTADYQCGISLGQRIFFYAKFANAAEAKLDYCLILNNAVQIAQRTGNLSTSWNLWQIPLNTSPTVALHMTGNGEHVTLIELWTSSY